jgi:hypothetical protein
MNIGAWSGNDFVFGSGDGKSALHNYEGYAQWGTDGNRHIVLIPGGSGNVGIGTTSPSEKLEVDGNIKISGNINAKYQDVAEWVPSSERLKPGTVVIVDPTRDNEVVSSQKAYDTRVAGVVSHQPGLLLGEGGKGQYMIAHTGRVKVKVDARFGAIHKGDLLTTSSIPGVAMKSQPIDFAGAEIHRPGTILGKALESLNSGQSEMLVLLSLQ